MWDISVLYLVINIFKFVLYKVVNVFEFDKLLVLQLYQLVYKIVLFGVLIYVFFMILYFFLYFQIFLDIVVLICFFDDYKVDVIVMRFIIVDVGQWRILDGFFFKISRDYRGRGEILVFL